ncbi:MAG: RIP metalloprotease RseP [Clostridia bacterium]|nr:RIP metalloprotease RseP [Clostridia bacterium]
MVTVLIALLCFGIIIMFHELGHFVAAKSVGIKVDEFSIGMGPKIFKFKGKDTFYSLRVLPIGGFVKMAGEDEESNDKNAFNNQPVWKRILTIASGPLMNFILAIIVLSIIGYNLGVPIPVVDGVEPGMPGYQAGIKPGDRFISVNSVKVKSADDVRKIINDNAGKDITMSLKRGQETVDVKLTPTWDEELQMTRIGINFKVTNTLHDSITYGFKQTINLIYLMIQGLGQLIFGKADMGNVIGPVGIISEVGKAAQVGIFNLLWLVTIITINLGIINLIPFPALDGGRLIFLIIEGIRRKPVDRTKEGLVHFTGFALLMLLMLYITFKDIIRLK